MADRIIQSREADITTITINREEIGNRVTDDMAAQLVDMITNAARDSRLILFKGAGQEFCLGRDEPKKKQGPPPEAYDLKGMFDVIFNLYDAFRNAPVPIIGVVQGKAIGFGCALAALCDITIASDKAIFQLPEMAHNIMPTMAMSALVDRIQRKALLYLVYSTAEIDAATALTFGLVSRVVPGEHLESAVAELVAAIQKSPLPSVKAVKEYAGAALGIDTPSANVLAKNLHATINSSSKMRP